MPQLYIAKYTLPQSKRKPRWITAMPCLRPAHATGIPGRKIIQLFQQYKSSKFYSEARQSFWAIPEICRGCL